ncbi:MAG TPA: tyrosine-type recombinase/integrase [Candidatus Sulfotelmatobacter sp.]
MTSVTNFVETEYFTHVRASLAASTVSGYQGLWRMHGKRFDGLSLEIRTCDAQGILRRIAAENPALTKTTLGHAKAFFSGIWTHALRMGVTNQQNPWPSVAIPTAPEPTETYAYSATEIETMLRVLDMPAELAVLTAACTGLRKSEIKGLRCQDWDAASSTLSVRQSVWRKHVGKTKSKASKAPVPVVPILADRLKRHCANRAGPEPIFVSSVGTPLDLDNVARREIVPALENTSVRWHGWHAMRRGLATFLHAKGIPDKEIQSILRHSNVAVTQSCYVRTIPQNVRLAMDLVDFGSGGNH